MKLNKFIKECALEETLIGDLAKDILRDENFPSKKSEKEIIEYLEFYTTVNCTNDILKEFLNKYNRVK